ncbi:hypothetical protein D3C86_1300450 [compost metagenome]
MGHAFGGHFLHALHPAYRGGGLAHQGVLDLGRVVGDGHVHVVDDRDRRRRERQPSHALLEAVRSRLQQRRMERRRHRQRQRALGALGLGDLAGLFHGGLVAGNHHLRGGVEIDGLDHAGSGRLGASRTHVVIGQAQDGGHAALAHRHGFLHRLCAEAHQRHSVSKRNHARGHQRRVLAQAVAGHQGRGRAAGVQPGAVHGHGGSQHHRLGVGREVQFFRRTFRDQAADVLPQRGGSFLQRGADHRVVGKRVEHADRLRALARENECEFHRESSLNDSDERVRAHAPFQARRAGPHLTCAAAPRPR